MSRVNHLLGGLVGTAKVPSVRLYERSGSTNVYIDSQGGEEEEVKSYYTLSSPPRFART